MPDPDLRPLTSDRRETVALVIPLFNEEAVLPLLIEEVERFRVARPEVTQVVLVDDGSRDATLALARRLTDGRPGYVLVAFARNFGHQLAVTAGLHVADADAAIILDADLQDPLDVAGQMIDRWREGYDVVYGVRETRDGESAFKKLTAAAFYRFFRWATDLEMPLDTGDFRLMSRRMIEAYRQLHEQQPFVRGLISWLGFNQVGLPYRRAARAAGETKYPLKKMLRFAMTGLTAFSDKPLRMAVWLGFGSAALAAGGIVWVLVVRLFLERAVPGWASTVLPAFFFGGVQLFFLGILGLYLGRVFDEVRGRPRYVVRETWESEARRAEG
ncbi:MAG TPA: glycosyltransferase family 2 protein [Rhodothermales bacterium]|nr:glycosyltransferase family 2 protein [Rhodothermales bacterium]